MNLTKTEAGARAYKLVDWAAGDPARAFDARAMIAQLQQNETDPVAKREIADAARMALRI